MKELFQGWRRKAGVVALLMACMLTSLWLWLERETEVMFSIGEHSFYLSTSWNGAFEWEYGRGYVPFRQYGGIPLMMGIVPQWAIHILTLLSAYLLLWKPQNGDRQPRQT